MRAALIGSDGPVRGLEFPLDADTVTIGRRDGNTIVIKEPTVSRQHAEIQRDARGFTLRDLGSADGIRVNGTPITGDYRLNDGDTIAIGASATFTMRLPAPVAADQPGTQPPDATPGLMTAPEMSDETRLGMVFSGPAPRIGSEAIFQVPETPPQSPATTPAVPTRSRRGLLIGLLVIITILVIAAIAIAVVVLRQ